MVECSKCGEFIDEPADTPLNQRSPCPLCDSKARFYKIELKDEITLHDKIRLKNRHGKRGEVKPFLLLQAGDDFYYKTGEWNYREKMEDKENYRYFEHIVNPRTGELIHHCEKPLSQHRGHGSAKRK